MSVSRNAPCPCGSGRKYKLCCLPASELVRRVARSEERVGERIRRWAEGEFPSELAAARQEYMFGMSLDPIERELFDSWFHSDRLLADGRTPAQRYAERPDLDGGERMVAARIAAARLGIHRVIDVAPGEWIQLEDTVDGVRHRVLSQNVSRGTLRWDLVLGRIMDGEPGALWGATRVLEPSEEPRLLDELARLERTDVLRDADLRLAIATHSLELMRFRSTSPTPRFFTLEGDPIAVARADCAVRDRASVEERLRTFGELERDEEPVIDITLARSRLVAERGELPDGALVFETCWDGDIDSIPVATLRLEHDVLRVEAMSERRLARAIEIVRGDFGDLVEVRAREVTPIEQALEQYRAAPDREPEPTGLPPRQERRLLEQFLTERMRRWIDEPLHELAGLTPRRAADSALRPNLERLVRNLENGAERRRRDGEPAADLGWIRDELGLRAAA
jgi:hypothetical protein